MMLCDMASGSTSHILRSHTAAVLALAWSPLRDHCLATGGQDNTIVLWDVRMASGPLMSLDQHNGSGSSNTSTGLLMSDYIRFTGFHLGFLVWG